MKNIIIIPYAYISEYKSGVNFKKQKVTDIYWKNCCVACVSAKRNAGKNTDVALVTNIELPSNYEDILKNNEIIIKKVPFDHFTFGKELIWSLAFYKLNAMWHICRETEYASYCYLDSDVFIQDSFDNIWKECEHNLLLYDICHGLQDKDYKILLQEIENLVNHSALGITHYGGEILAGNKKDVTNFIDECLKVYERMIKQDCHTTRGDEFIISTAASETSMHIRNAGAYIYRYWTRRFHLISTNYQFNPVTILHVPQEKEYGMLKIFDKYIKQGKLPSRKKVWRLLHLVSPSLLIRCSLIIERFK